MCVLKVQQQLDKPEAIRKIKITSKPKEGAEGIGDIVIVRKAFPDIIEALAGRPKAFFYATCTHGQVKLHCEAKIKNIW